METRASLNVPNGYRFTGSAGTIKLMEASDLTNPWLARFIRELRHPRPRLAEDNARAAALVPPLTRALAACGTEPAAFDLPPDHSSDPAATAYCPRCHAMFLEQAAACPDCRGLALMPFGGAVG